LIAVALCAFALMAAVLGPGGAGTAAAASPNPFEPPKLDLTAKFCGTYQCLCIDIDPEECTPDQSGRNGGTALNTTLAGPQPVKHCLEAECGADEVPIRFVDPSCYAHEGADALPWCQDIFP
jgi:hypothetical protein